MPLPPFFSLRPVTTPGLSAAAYVPWVMVSRALAFLRTLLVAHLLGQAGKEAFGLYQPALEFINPLAALVMFGAGDVAERYVAAILTNVGPLGLRRWLWSQWIRLGVTGIVVSALLMTVGLSISVAVWGHPRRALLLTCAVAVILLALYQHLAATLRALRAYAAAAGMELCSSSLLLAFSVAAAWYWDYWNAHLQVDPWELVWGPTYIGALGLVAAYGTSLAIPLAVYAMLLDRHLRTFAGAATETAAATFRPHDILPYAARVEPPRMTRFAIWALVRLLLVLVFGFLSIWGVRYLMDTRSLGTGLESTASFSIPFRIAQLLAFLAVTIWASSYGIAARAHSHGQIRRSHAQLFRIGRLGAAALALIAAALLLTRGLFAWALPAYAAPIDALLPGMLALFLWYGLAAFFSAYADLRESPQRGAALWAAAVLVQVAAITLARFAPAAIPNFLCDPQHLMLYASAAGLLVALLIVAPALLGRPFHRALAIPMILLTAAPATLFLPATLVNWIAPPILLTTVALLYFTGHLLRPFDRRALHRSLGHKQARVPQRRG